jgi:hypothetical protein
VPVVACERPDQRGGVRAAAQGERGQVEPRRPALGPADQPLDVGRIELDAEGRAQKTGGLAARQAKLGRGDDAWARRHRRPP